MNAAREQRFNYLSGSDERFINFEYSLLRSDDMPPMVQLTADPTLQDGILVASFSTARELRTVLKNSGLAIESCDSHDDETISVSVDLYDEFSAFLRAHQMILE